MKKKKLFTILFVLVTTLLLINCSTATKYQPVIGKPQMLSNKNILITSIEGVSDMRSQRNFEILREKLSESFGEILFLPSSEYDLARGGVSKENVQDMFSNIEVRKRFNKILKVDYILKIGLNANKTEEEQRKAALSDKTVYTFKIYDMFQPSPISQFNVVVKSRKDGLYFDSNTGFTYQTVDADTEKAAVRRAAKEILNVRVQNY